MLYKYINIYIYCGYLVYTSWVYRVMAEILHKLRNILPRSLLLRVLS